MNSHFISSSKASSGLGFIEFLIVGAVLIPIVFSSLDFALYFSSIQQAQRLAEEVANASLRRCIFKNVDLQDCIAKLRDGELLPLLSGTYEDFLDKGVVHVALLYADQMGNESSQQITIGALGKNCNDACNTSALTALLNIRKTLPGPTGLAASEVYYEYRPMIRGNPLISYFLNDSVAHGFAVN